MRSKVRMASVGSSTWASALRLQRVQHHAKRIFIERLDSPTLREQAHRRDLGRQRHHTLQHAGTIEDFRDGMNLDLIHIPIVIRFPSICQQSLKRLQLFLGHVQRTSGLHLQNPRISVHCNFRSWGRGAVFFIVLLAFKGSLLPYFS